jgi:agmatine deiminase
VGDLRLPADWEPHERCVMAWPGEESRAGSRAPEAIRDFALIARTIATFEPVLMLAYPEFVGHAEAACGPNVEIVELAFDDVWIRDSGPLFAVRGGNELVAVDFRFNRYGWKEVPRERFAETGVLLARELGIPRVEVPYVLEGGSITTNGEGTLIAVESSILTETRNPGATRDDLEGAFAEFLGIERTIWLEQGLEEDRTDGHADNVAVFIGPSRVLCQTVADPNDPNASRLAANQAVLEAAGLEVVELPILPYSQHEGRRLARTYVNSFIGNGCVVVPLTATPADAEGLAGLREAFPRREVVGVPGETLARAGGGVHCITQHVPLLTRES